MKQLFEFSKASLDHGRVIIQRGGEFMSDKKPKKNNNNKPSNVVSLPDKCPAEGCSKMAQRSAFCHEHFAWFKEGLINRKGERPKDFDKKYEAFTHKKAS